MTAMIGHRTASGEQLRGFVERIEAIRKDKKILADDEAAVRAEAKAAGFQAKPMMEAIRRRAMRPADRQEAEAVLDTYLHALGMISDLPLFRQVGLINADVAQRDQVIEAMKKFAPEGGSITVEAGGTATRITRAKDGTVTVADVVETPKPKRPDAGPAAQMPERPSPPDVDDAGAEALGRTAFGQNQPIIANPFPFGDARRRAWDEGWRAASGSDGMGPDE